MRGRRIVMAAFDQGAVPTISFVNCAKTPLGVNFDKLIAALQKFLDECFVPIWGTPAKLKKAKRPVPGTWTMVFLDEPDAPNALGYHDLTKHGLPLSKVFVKPTLKNGDKVSVTACHELAEMMVDPAINLWAEGPDNSLYAYEMCDAVEEEEFLIDGIAMSDFVYPAYFEFFRKPKSTQFDYLKKISRPYQILPGGYSIVRKRAQETQIFASSKKEKKFAREDRRFHRSYFRTARLRDEVTQLVA